MRIWNEGFDGAAEVQDSAAGPNVVAGCVVQVGERDGGNSHVAGRGGLHGFAHDLGGGGDGNQVEFFAESADQDGMPEAVDGLFRLAVLVEPVLEGLSGVALLGERERDEGARDCQFVGDAEEREMQERRRGVQRRGERR